MRKTIEIRGIYFNYCEVDNGWWWMIAHPERKNSGCAPTKKALMEQVTECAYQVLRHSQMNTNSKGHVTWIGEYEYYLDEDGELWRAHRTNIIDRLTGYRIGRMEAPAHMAQERIELLKSLQ